MKGSSSKRDVFFLLLFLIASCLRSASVALPTCCAASDQRCTDAKNHTGQREAKGRTRAGSKGNGMAVMSRCCLCLLLLFVAFWFEMKNKKKQEKKKFPRRESNPGLVGESDRCYRYTTWEAEEDKEASLHDCAGDEMKEKNRR